MKRKAIVSVLLALILLVSVLPAVQASGPDPTSGVTDGTGVHLVSSDAEGIVVEVVSPHPDLKEVVAGAERYEQVSMQGFDTASQPGMPELPVASVMLGVPEGAQWDVELLTTDRVVMEGPFRILPGLTRQSQPAPWSSRDQSAEEARTPDGGTYAVNAFFPAEVAEITESGYLRDQRYVVLRFNPLRYNPVTGGLEWYRRIRLRVRLSGANLGAAGNGEQDGYFEPVLRATILNYEQAKAWRVRSSAAASAAMAPICGNGPQYKVMVGSEGMYEITYTDLSAAGFPVGSVDPRKIMMCYMGQEVAIQVIGEGDGIFNPSDRIRFYGVNPYSRYTDESTYWLTYVAANARRMELRSATPNAATPLVPSHTLVATAEESHRYDSLFPSPKGDHWFWDDLRWLDVSPFTPRSYTITLDEPPAGADTATLHVGLQGYTPNLHELNFSMNGQALGTRQWESQTYQTLSFPIPVASLHAGTNTLTLTSKDQGATPDGVWLDFFSVEYRAPNIALQGQSLTFSGRAGPSRYWVTGFADATAEAYDVTDVWNVARMSASAKQVQSVRLPVAMKQRKISLSGASAPESSQGSLAAQGYGIAFQGNAASVPKYWAGTSSAVKRPLSLQQDQSSNWRSPSNGADYLVITDRSLAAEAARLVGHQQDQGLQALTVYVQDIYDEFNYGQPDPEAIHSFLQYTYDQWSLRPSYVLLLGDGSFDYRDYFGSGEKEIVPPLLGMVDPDIGETATDHAYAAVHGDDVLPDMYIGRLPAADLADAHAMVDKILNYAVTSGSGGWDRKMVFVSDNYRDNHDTPVEVDDFISVSNGIYSEYAVSPYTGARVYYDPSPSGAGLPGHYANSAAAKAAVLAAFNQGSLLWNFMGHSSYEQWAVENLFHAQDVPGLTNGSRLPVLLEMTCFTGSFHLADGVSLDEELIRLPVGGTVASWSPTGLGLATGHEVMQQAFYEAVFESGTRQLGPAIAIGTVRAYNSGYTDLVDTFLLLGDPALFLR